MPRVRAKKYTRDAVVSEDTLRASRYARTRRTALCFFAMSRVYDLLFDVRHYCAHIECFYFAAATPLSLLLLLSPVLYARSHVMPTICADKPLLLIRQALRVFFQRRYRRCYDAIIDADATLIRHAAAAADAPPPDATLPDTRHVILIRCRHDA